MSVPRFYLAPEVAQLEANRVLRLPETVARHALQVLRLRSGDAIVLFDGQGGEYSGSLVVSGRHADARVGAHAAIERERTVPVTLVQSLVAADVMDDIVRKAVELGVAAIVPVLAQRSQRPPADRLDRRVARWRQIAIAACEQCGRNRIADIAEIVALDDWIHARSDLADTVVLDPAAEQPLAALAPAQRACMLMVGPEGGLTAEEVRSARTRGALAAHLGPTHAARGHRRAGGARDARRREVASGGRRVARDQDAAADALDQHRVDRAAPPSEREFLAAPMADDQKIDPQAVAELGDHLDGLAVLEVGGDGEAALGEPGGRFLQVRFHARAVHRQRRLRHELAGEQVGRRVVDDAGQVDLAPGHRDEVGALVHRHPALRRAVEGYEDLAVHG
jgi:16S rRNA (uracil1498-N3)-methyltransferase